MTKAMDAPMFPEDEIPMTPSEVATLFRVDPKTITRWAKAGKLTTFRTLGGHRRYSRKEVEFLRFGSITKRKREQAKKKAEEKK